VQCSGGLYFNISMEGRGIALVLWGYPRILPPPSGEGLKAKAKN
jgi:hypothetical protein